MKRPAFRNQCKSKGVSTDGKKIEVIDRYLAAQAAGFPPKKQSKTDRERRSESRGKRSEKKKQDDNAKFAKDMSRLRADRKTAIEERWPTYSTLQGEKPGKEYKLERHTDNVETAVHLFHLESGGWMYRESEWLVAYLHVMKRLEEADDSCISKLNSLLELSIERYSTLYKTLYQEVLDNNDMKQVCKWKSQTEHRQLMNRKEAVLEWFATTDSISLDDCKAENGIFNCRSLVGLKLKVRAHWWNGCSGNRLWRCEVESIDFHDAAERYFTIKCLDHDPGDPHQEKRYQMAYEAICEYADHEQDNFSRFNLPREPVPYIDSALNIRCEETLKELRKLDGKATIHFMFCSFQYLVFFSNMYYLCTTSPTSIKVCDRCGKDTNGLLISKSISHTFPNN